jgi:catechol 2,3-dioxygenase-like lactoylglutathione lyase family enzyme
MLGSADIVGFVSTTDPARARTFYADTLGLQVESESPFAVVFRVSATMLRVTVVEELAPQPFTVLGWDVPDIVATIRRLSARGVAFERYDGMEQDKLGVWRAPSGARIAWFKDPDGNVLSLTQFTPGPRSATCTARSA